MLLFINACVRKESRTKRLADYLIARLEEPVREEKLFAQTFPVTDQAFLAMRDEKIAAEAFDDPCFALAREFAAADTVVVAAPYWDLSFPAMLKQYFEQINVTGVTFSYSPEGIPVTRCRAKRLYYVTTAGGKIFSDECGFGYVKMLAKGLYQIPLVQQVKAEGLDVEGADVPAILRRAEMDIDRLVKG